ncbi:MAG TPA: penicillin-binding protein 2 [Oleiagrimonas sp.]|nr:penicillin-binding protein 2 [Oleiagrimonas sp.]
MTKRQPLKNQRTEMALFRRRAMVGFALIVVCLLVLCARFFWLQVLQHDKFATRSRENRVHVRVLPPPRGLIYGRHGVLLADNVPAFRLGVVPEQVEDMDAMLKRLGQIVPISKDDLKDFHRQLKQHRAFQEVPLKMQLTEDEIDRFAVNSWRFPGVHVVPYLKRYYPHGAMFAHVIGHVGRISDKDLKEVDAKAYEGTQYYGKSGIEHHYETLLHGQPGYEVDEVNAAQRVVRVLSVHPPTPGKSLYLSLDIHLQKAAVKALHGRAGAVVAIDPRNGEVLAMVSQPSFNPNLFVNGISQHDYSALLENPAKPLVHRALRGGYPPGSTVKPFLGLGGLVMGYRTPEDTVMSTGVFHIPGYSRGYRDDQRWGVGKTDLVKAIAKSVNTYFYKLAYDMGIDNLDKWMSQFGFGKPTGIDLDGEGSGVLPSRAWKRAHRTQPWYIGETVIAGIGQGYWVVTPLQLAHAVATLADRGVPHRPHLLTATQQGVDAPVQELPPVKPGNPIVHNIDNWKVVRKGMLNVVYGTLGSTARGIGDGFPYLIAGKTGTAERYSRNTTAYDTGASHSELAQRHRALFICYTPAKNPQIAVAVIVDHGAWGGSTAGPIARAVLDAWAKEHPAPASSPETAREVAR